MAGSKAPLTVSGIVGWGSALLSFGMVQGALYLKAFWGKFGLDPFQFAGVSELALIGLTAMGVTLALMAVAALVGAGFESGANRTGKRRVIGVLVGTGVGVGFIYSVWISGSWPLLVGVATTIAIILTIMLSPVVPRAIKDSSALPFGALVIVYFSFTSAHLGGGRAKSVITGEQERAAKVIMAGGDERVMSFVGRLGDTYVFWKKEAGEVVLIPCGEVKAVAILVTSNKAGDGK